MKLTSQLSSLSTNGNGHLSSLNGHAPHGAVRSFVRDSLLFIEGDECAGVFVLRSGRVKLSIVQPGGKSVIIGIAEPGDIVGLASAVDGAPYEGTAEALEDCETEFVGRNELIRSLTAEAGLGLHALRQISRNYLDMCETLVSLSASEPVIVRLARLLVSWMPQGNGHSPVILSSDLTHQQIAEMIGTTRETVTRALSEMRCRGLVTLKNGELDIHDNDRLRLLASNGTSPAAQYL